MTRKTSCFVLFCFVIFALTKADDDPRWNTPPKLTTGSTEKENGNNDPVQARLLPFSASFSFAAGGNNAHSLSVGGNQEGITLSQSSSQNKGPGTFPNSGSLAASQSSSFSAGLSGISISDSNAFDLNRPWLSGSSQAQSNSFTFGEANASSHGKVENGKVISGAHSSVGNSQSSISSGASSNAGSGGSSSEPNANYLQDTQYLQNQNQNQQYGRPYWNNISPSYENGGFGSSNPYQPTLQIGQRPQGWSQTNWRKPIQLDIAVDDDRWEHRVPEVHITNGWKFENTPIQETWNPYSCYRRPNRFSNSREEYEWNRRCGRNINRYHGGDKSLSANHYQPQVTITSSSQTLSPFWINEHHQKPGVHVSTASASSGASSTGNGFSFGHSSSKGSSGPQGLSSLTFNHAQTSGNGHSNAQGAAAAVHQDLNGNSDSSFSSGTVIGTSMGNGDSIGTAISGNKKGDSIGHVNNQVNGSGSIHGTANSGSVASIHFSGVRNPQIIPSQFVRSKLITDDKIHARKNHQGSVDEFLSDITDTVAEIFDV